MQGQKIETKYIPRFNPDVNVLEITRTKDGDYMVQFRHKEKSRPPCCGQTVTGTCTSMRQNSESTTRICERW